MRVVLWASVRMYGRRYAAAVIAVVLGVGFVVAATSMGSAARDGVRASVGAQYAGTDVVVQTANRAQARAVAALAGSDGVEAAATSWFAYQRSGPDTGSPVAVGSVATDPALAWQQLVGGELPSTAGEVAVTAAYAQSREVGIGDELPLGSRTRTVTGIVANAGAGGADVYAPESVLAATRSAYPAGTVLVSAEGTELQTVIARVAAAVPTATVLSTGAHVDQVTRELTGDVDVIGNLLLGFAVVALFVAAMVVANTFTIVLAQRARDVALLRCVGAQRAQVIRSAIAEAALVGLVAGALGVLAGLVITAGAVAALGDRFAEVPLVMPDLSTSAVAVPWLVGALVTALSAVLPAVRASWVEPLAALRMDDRVDVRSRAGALRLVASVVAMVVGVAALVIGADSGSVPVGVAGGMMSFASVLWAGPVLVPGAVRLLGQPARLAGVPGRLALANSARNPRRTAATALALLVGVTLISMLTIGTASSQATAQRLNDDYHPIDVAVSARTSLNASVVDQLQTVEGVDASVVLLGTPVRIGGRSLQVAGVDAADVDPVLRSRVGVVPGAGELLVSFAVMDELGVDPGSTVTLHGAEERATLVVRPGEAWGESLLVSAAVFDRLATTLAPAAVWLHVADDADPADAMAAIETVADADGASVAGGLDVRVQLDQVLAVVVAVAAGLLGVAVLIALVGVSNTLSLSVLERTRENALLRALGLSAVRMRLMLAVEALLLTAIAAVLGIGLGAAYAWFGVQTLLGPEYGTDIVFRLPWGQLALVIGVAVGAGLLASWLPARRAARTAPVAAL